MAVFFNGAFTRELRREADRRLRRDTVEKAHAHIFGSSPFSARRLFSGLGTRRTFSGRSKVQALSEPMSQRVGTSRNNYSSSGNQSRSSVYRGRDTQKKQQPTSGTKPSQSTSPSGRTTSSKSTRPTRATTANLHAQSGSNSNNSRRFQSNARQNGTRRTQSHRQPRFHSSVT